MQSLSFELALRHHRSLGFPCGLHPGRFRFPFLHARPEVGWGLGVHAAWLRERVALVGVNYSIQSKSWSEHEYSPECDELGF